jgi:hypothetical protein
MSGLSQFVDLFFSSSSPFYIHTTTTTTNLHILYRHMGRHGYAICACVCVCGLWRREIYICIVMMGRHHRNPSTLHLWPALSDSVKIKCAFFECTLHVHTKLMLSIYIWHIYIYNSFVSISLLTTLFCENRINARTHVYTIACFFYYYTSIKARNHLFNTGDTKKNDHHTMHL